LSLTSKLYYIAQRDVGDKHVIDLSPGKGFEEGHHFWDQEHDWGSYDTVLRIQQQAWRFWWMWM
jgi:hypothetical protein